MKTETVASSSGSGFAEDPERNKSFSKLTSRLMSFILIMVICLNMVTPANAYSSVHIQCSIDLATWEILTSVVKDEVGISASSPEWRRMTEDDLNALAAAGGQFSLSTDLIDEANVGAREKPVAHGGNILSGLNGVIQNFGVNTEKNRVLTFPTDQDNRNSSSSIDMENALNANNAIVFDLNQAFNIFCERRADITKTPDATAMLSAIKLFMASLSPSGDYVSYYASTEGNDKVNYRWRVEKYKGDSSEYITWNMLIVEAFNNFSLQGEEAIDSENVYGSSMPNQLSKMLTSMLGNMLDSLRGILGMWSMDELLFNQGWRNAGYIGGIFPRSWESTIWALFIFMEIIGAMILLFGVLNNVLKQAASTINTIARIHAMSQIQDILVCAVALTLLPVALRMIIALSGNLIDIISTMRPISATTGEPKEITEMVQRFSSSSGSIGGVIAQFLFFGIQVYFNFFYAIRSLSVAFLIIIAPMMIAMITVSSARKQTTVNWMKELMANILIQPIHTFIITVILILPTSTHGFDNLVALYAMIPLTSMIRGLFFGPAGGWMDQASNRGKLAVTGAIGGAAIGAASAGVSGLAGVIKGQSGGGSGSNGGSDGSGGEGGNTSPDNNLDNSKSGGTSNNSASNTNAGAGSGGGPDSGGGGVGGENAAGGESGNAPAMNDAADSGTQTPSPANIPNSSSGDKTQNTPFSQTSAGKVLTPVAKIGGGMLLGAVGGAIAGAGYGQVGSPIEHAGVSLASSTGTHRGKGNEESEDKDTQKRSQNADQTDNARSDGGDESLSRQRSDSNAPVNLGSAGRRKANEISGDKEMQVRELKQGDLDRIGISQVDDSKKALEFTAKGDSPQAQELGAYADYLQSLPVDERKKEVDERGCMATRTDDGIQVRIDKDKWSKANDGAQIRAFTNDKGDTTMRIKSPEGAKIPSFQGSAPKYAPVSAAAIPAATVSFGARMKSGEAVQESAEARKKMEAAGMSEGNIKRASERAGRISQLRAQGYSPMEAAKMSKRDMAGLDRSCEVSIPTAELSPEQQNTMIQAQQRNLVSNTGDAYTAKYEPDGVAFSAAFNDENAASSIQFGTEAQDDASFTVRAGQMNEIQAVQLPTVTGQASPRPSASEPPSFEALVNVGAQPSVPVSSATPVPAPSEQNGVSTVSSTSIPFQPTTGINPALAQRVESYKAAKQTTGSTTEAYKAAHRNIGGTVQTPQPVKASSKQTSYDSGSFGVSRTARPAPHPTPTPAPAPTGAPAPVPTSSPVPMQNTSSSHSFSYEPPAPVDSPVPPSTSHLTDRGVTRLDEDPFLEWDERMDAVGGDEKEFPFTVEECFDNEDL